MKSVLVLRHGKSTWKHLELADHDRPLNERGKRDAPLMGRLLKKEDLVPEIIISSTARRARSTAEAVAKASRYKGEIILDKSLYADMPIPSAYAQTNTTQSNTLCDYTTNVRRSRTICASRRLLGCLP